MIELIFEFGNEVVLVLIDGHTVSFGSTSFGAHLADISGLKLSHAGVCKEFPDLELANDWEEQAVQRFKEKIGEMKSENEICDYIITELEKQGYTAKQKRREGFRPVNL